MKNAIKVICFVLVVIIAGVGSGYVYFTWDVGEYETVDASEFGTVKITAYIGEETDITIPKRIRGKKVVSIDEGAFRETDITSVKLNDNIVSVGDNAFRECKNLTSIDLGNSVKSIGDNVFEDSKKLTEVKFSPVLEKVGHFLFGNNSKLETIDLNGNENFKLIDGVLYSADMKTIYLSLISADLSKYACPDTVTQISAYSFFGQDELKSFKINNGVKAIQEGTFGECKALSEITISDTVTSIGPLALFSTDIKSIEIPATVTKIDDTVFYNSEKKITVITTKGSNAAKFAEKNEYDLKIVDAL